MKKSLFLFLIVNLLTSLLLVNGQDVIVKENGEEIKSKVLEVGKNVIKYKNFDDPEFATYSIEKEEIAKIRYEDGTEKIFPKNLVSSYMGLSVFSANPTGEFGSTNTNLASSGYAMRGSGIMMDAGVYFAKNFGMSIALGGFNNPIDTIEVAKPYQSLDTSDFDFHNASWKTGYLMIGPLYSFKIGKKFAFDTKFMMGPMAVRKPAYSYHYSNTLDYNYNYGEGGKVTLGFLTGVAFRYHITRKFGLRLGVDYMFGKPRIGYDVTITEPGNASNPVIKREERHMITQKVSVLKVELGVLLLFKR